MSKKTMKLISVLTIILSVIMTMSTCFAIDPSNVDTDYDEAKLGGVEKIGNTIATTIRTVGVILSVVMLMILGIKYMMGSAEEKAEYKKTMIPYIIGAVLIFAASNIASIVMNFSGSITAE